MAKGGIQTKMANSVLMYGKSLVKDISKKSMAKHKNQAHPTIKPKEIIERMIRASSKKGDLVLDLFSGSGTTSLVARELERNFIGCEASIEYVDSSLNIKEC